MAKGQKILQVYSQGICEGLMNRNDQPSTVIYPVNSLGATSTSVLLYCEGFSLKSKYRSTGQTCSFVVDPWP